MAQVEVADGSKDLRSVIANSLFIPREIISSSCSLSLVMTRITRCRTFQEAFVRNIGLSSSLTTVVRFLNCRSISQAFFSAAYLIIRSCTPRGSLGILSQTPSWKSYYGIVLSASIIQEKAAFAIRLSFCRDFGMISFMSFLIMKGSF